MEESKPKRILLWLILAGIAAVLGVALQYTGAKPTDDLGGFAIVAIRFFGGMIVSGCGALFSIAAISTCRKNTKYLAISIIIAGLNLWLLYEALH